MNFYSPSLNAHYDYDANRIRWRRILNVNEIIEIKSLVSRGPKHFKLAMAWCRTALSGSVSLVALPPLLVFFNCSDKTAISGKGRDS